MLIFWVYEYFCLGTVVYIYSILHSCSTILKFTTMVTSKPVKRIRDSGANHPSIMVSFGSKKPRLDKANFSSETTGE